jgi:hypothetical protein
MRFTRAILDCRVDASQASVRMVRMTTSDDSDERNTHSIFASYSFFQEEPPGLVRRPCARTFIRKMVVS